MKAITITNNELLQLKLLLRDIQLIQKLNSPFDNEAIEILSFKIIDHLNIDDHIPDIRKMIEISDEEIKTVGESYRIFYNGKEGNGNLVYKHYLEGIKWYREQLKSRQ